MDEPPHKSHTSRSQNNLLEFRRSTLDTSRTLLPQLHSSEWNVFGFRELQACSAL